MFLSELTAVSPLDGRYREKVEALDAFFSEFALIKYRVKIEIDYFISLCDLLPQLKMLNTNDNKQKLLKIYTDFSLDDALRIKAIEKTINHDVKAIEYFLKEQFDQFLWQDYKEFIHFALTSQDINNTALPLALKEALEKVYLPDLQDVIDYLKNYAQAWKDIPMLAKTHGQPATPTRMGKEINVFVYRLDNQLILLKNIPISAKFGGATGNFNAHLAAYPDIDWPAFANHFINNVIGLKREEWTTQISNYDNLAAIFDGLRRINTILIDLCRDIWQYISLDYFKLKISEKEVGSSAMPHKVNPIDFENAEGNLGIANALLTHLSMKLPVSRLQRDLTDSTVLRNIGVPLAHTVIALKSIVKGLGRLLLDDSVLEKDLEAHWSVVAEAVQTILRREGYPQPYETLKKLTRTNEVITAQSIAQFIESLQLNQSVKKELKSITPHNYLGIN
ncbi:MAG: adenylosuccinate lyase [Tannerella sp.]|jgi:adenylosuccinate lyase|nr:adenylosuccinate lyase [Tannerella sp.]